LVVDCSYKHNQEKRQRFDEALSEFSLLELNKKEALERWKRQIKEILYETQQSIATAKARSDSSLNVSRLKQREAMVEYKSDIKFVNYMHKEKEVGHCDLIRNLNEHYDRRIADLRADFQNKKLEVIGKSNQEMKIAREEVEEKVKKEVNSVEELKELEANALMMKNEEVRPSPTQMCSPKFTSYRFSPSAVTASGNKTLTRNQIK